MIRSKEPAFINKNIENGNKNKLQDADSPIHSWYQFVLGYPPHLVQYYLSKFDIQPTQIVLDPFCGTGTTPVECMKSGIPYYGIEANRMAYFASTVKTNLNLESSSLSNALGYILQSAKLSFEYHHIAEASTHFLEFEYPTCPITVYEIPVLTTEQMKIIPAGFISERPLQKVMILKAIIEKIEDTKIRDFFTLSLANLIVKKAGNIGFGPEIYRRKPKLDIDALDYFISNSNRMIQDVLRFNAGRTIPKRITIKSCSLSPYLPIVSEDGEDYSYSQKIIHGDSRNVNNCLNSKLLGKIDCIITSPPYPNEKDYTRSTRLESVLLGFIHDKKDLRTMKESLLRSNSRNVFVGDTDSDNIKKFDSIEKIANEIEEKRIHMKKDSGFEKLYHKIVRHYFGGMYLHLKTLKPFLSPNAQLAYVVGDQMSFFQTVIPTADLLGEVAESLGYRVREIELWRTRYATATSRSIDENVLILENK
jgi:DNA modification methylase